MAWVMFLCHKILAPPGCWFAPGSRHVKCIHFACACCGGVACSWDLAGVAFLWARCGRGIGYEVVGLIVRSSHVVLVAWIYWDTLAAVGISSSVRLCCPTLVPRELSHQLVSSLDLLATVSLVLNVGFV